MAADLKGVLKKTLVTALSLSLVITLMPLLASALTQDVTTAKGNETSTGNVLGGVPTRVTWEAVVDKGESVSSVTVQFPEGSDLTADSSARLTVLNGIERLSVDAQPVIDEQNESVTVDFATPLEAGLRVRIETYNACLPNITGEVTLSGSFTRDDGQVEQLAQSPSIEVTQASLAQKIVNWMDEQPFIQAWNSVTVLRLFLEPQLIVSSIPTVFTGWLISLALCLVGFPLAIPIGLAAAFMKISRSKIMHVVAALYTGVIRGTPLFLQIYIAFFGLPLMGINLNQYVLAVMVMAFNSGAYMCEILRAGIQSIPKGQFEASRSLGMNQAQTMFSVIIPQTVRRVIPTMTSEFILLYKDTSLLAAVGVMELMLYSRSVVALTGNMTPYIVAAFFYLVVTLPLIRVVTVLEKRLALADNGGGAPAPKAKRKLRLGAKKQAAPQAASDDQKGADGE